MDRYSVALNKKPKKKITNLIKKVLNKDKGKEKEKEVPVSTNRRNITEERPVSFQPIRPIRDVREGMTPNVGVGIGTSMVNMEPSFLQINPTPQPLQLAPQNDGLMSVQGPTSQHVVLAGPDGYRVVIPLRILRYSITHNQDNTSDICITLPRTTAVMLEADILRGIERWERNRGLRG